MYYSKNRIVLLGSLFVVISRHPTYHSGRVPPQRRVRKWPRGSRTAADPRAVHRSKRHNLHMGSGERIVLTDWDITQYNTCNKEIKKQSTKLYLSKVLRFFKNDIILLNVMAIQCICAVECLADFFTYVFLFIMLIFMREPCVLLQ